MNRSVGPEQWSAWGKAYVRGPSKQHTVTCNVESRETQNQPSFKTVSYESLTIGEAIGTQRRAAPRGQTTKEHWWKPR